MFGVPQMASEEEGRTDAHKSPEKLTIRGQLLTGSTACERPMPMWWELGTQKSSELFLFSDRGCARPCYSLASSTGLLRRTPLETTHRGFRNIERFLRHTSVGSPLEFPNSHVLAQTREVAMTGALP